MKECQTEVNGEKIGKKEYGSEVKSYNRNWDIQGNTI